MNLRCRGAKGVGWGKDCCKLYKCMKFSKKKKKPNLKTMAIFPRIGNMFSAGLKCPPLARSATTFRIFTFKNSYKHFQQKSCFRNYVRMRVSVFCCLSWGGFHNAIPSLSS